VRILPLSSQQFTGWGRKGHLKAANEIPSSTATISESQSQRSSQSLTPTNARNFVCSTRTRSTSLSTSDQSKHVPFEDAWASPRVERFWRRRRSGVFTFLNGSMLSR
jgi:hypothetical protein